MIEGMTTPSVYCGFSGREVRFIAQSDGEHVYLAKQRLCTRTNTWKDYPGTNSLDEVVLAMMQASADQTGPQGPQRRYGWGLNGHASR